MGGGRGGRQRASDAGTATGGRGKNNFAANAAPFSVRLRTLLRALEHSADYAGGSRKPGDSQARIMLWRYV
jgi:hypothetical protein